MAVIVLLANTISNGACVLIGFCCSQLLSSIIYYLFLRHLFNNFGKEYEFKYTVKTFNIKRKDKIDKLRQEKQRRKDEFREKHETI